MGYVQLLDVLGYSHRDCAETEIALGPCYQLAARTRTGEGLCSEAECLSGTRERHPLLTQGAALMDAISACVYPADCWIANRIMALFPRFVKLLLRISVVETSRRSTQCPARLPGSSSRLATEPPESACLSVARRTYAQKLSPFRGDSGVLTLAQLSWRRIHCSLHRAASKLVLCHCETRRGEAVQATAGGEMASGPPLLAMAAVSRCSIRDCHATLVWLHPHVDKGLVLCYSIRAGMRHAA